MLHIKQPHVITEEAVGFMAQLEKGEIQAVVKLTKLNQTVIQPISTTQFQTVQQWPQLEFSVQPSESRLAQELFGALQNWAADFAPSSWKRLWWRYRFLFAILLVFWLVFGFLIGIFDVRMPTHTYVEQAHKIVADGVTDSNEHKAIELILALESHDEGDTKSVMQGKPGRRYWAVVAGVAFALGSLIFCPTVVIGIWKGKSKLNRWRVWTKWIFVTVPGVVFLTILWPRILSFFGV